MHALSGPNLEWSRDLCQQGHHDITMALRNTCPISAGRYLTADLGALQPKSSPVVILLGCSKNFAAAFAWKAAETATTAAAFGTHVLFVTVSQGQGGVPMKSIMLILLKDARCCISGHSSICTSGHSSTVSNEELRSAGMLLACW